MSATWVARGGSASDELRQLSGDGGIGDGSANAGMGGIRFDSIIQAAHQPEMLAEAVRQGVLTYAETDLFAAVHDAPEQFSSACPKPVNNGENATEREAVTLSVWWRRTSSHRIRSSRKCGVDA